MSIGKAGLGPLAFLMALLEHILSADELNACEDEMLREILSDK